MTKREWKLVLALTIAVVVAIQFFTAWRVSVNNEKVLNLEIEGIRRMHNQKPL